MRRRIGLVRLLFVGPDEIMPEQIQEEEDVERTPCVETRDFNAYVRIEEGIPQYKTYITCQ